MNLTPKTEHEAQKVNRAELTPASRVEESKDAYTLTVELPGVIEKDIEVTLENRVLSVTAENTVESMREHTLVLSEIPEARYRAAFDLPEHVNTEGIKATNKNGLLILTLPKHEEVKPRRIAVTVG